MPHDVIKHSGTLSDWRLGEDLAQSSSCRPIKRRLGRSISPSPSMA